MAEDGAAGAQLAGCEGEVGGADGGGGEFDEDVGGGEGGEGEGGEGEGWGGVLLDILSRGWMEEG